MSKGQPKRAYTPALAYSFLTPVYDLSVRLFTREKAWRTKVMELISPSAHDRILDIGCGTGTQAIWFKQHYPDCEIVGIDPDEKSLAIARNKSQKLNIDIEWVQGFVDAESIPKLGRFTRIVSSLVLHQTSISSKREIMQGARQMLEPSGIFCIADYGIQPNWAMKALYRLVVQNIDGYEDTQPNAEGFIDQCLGDVGFDSVTRECEFHTLTGSISVVVARVVGNKTIH